MRCEGIATELGVVIAIGEPDGKLWLTNVQKGLVIGFIRSEKRDQRACESSLDRCENGLFLENGEDGELVFHLGRIDYTEIRKEIVKDWRNRDLKDIIEECTERLKERVLIIGVGETAKKIWG